LEAKKKYILLHTSMYGYLYSVELSYNFEKLQFLTVFSLISAMLLDYRPTIHDR